MNRQMRIVTSLLVALACIALAAAPAATQPTGDELHEALAAVRRQRAELEKQLQALRQKELVLEKHLATEAKKGYYVRVEVKGLLQKQVTPNLFGGSPEEGWVQWSVTAGHHAFVLNWADASSQKFDALAKRLEGKAVVASGRLLSRSEKLPVLVVESFKAAEQ